MNTEIFVRKIYKDDAYSLRKAMVASADSISKYLPWGKTVQQWPFKIFKAMVREEMRLSNKYGAFVAVVDRQIVGYASFTDAWDEDGLQCLYWVHSSYQKRGIAKMLIDRLIDEAFLYRNIDYLEIHVTENNYGSHQVAKHFKPYASSSYVASEEAEKGFEDNGNYTVYYLVNPRTYAAYKAREILEGVSMPSIFSQRVHTAPGYSDMALARDLLNVLSDFNNEIQKLLN